MCLWWVDISDCTFPHAVTLTYLYMYVALGTVNVLKFWILYSILFSMLFMQLFLKIFSISALWQDFLLTSCRISVGFTTYYATKFDSRSYLRFLAAFFTWHSALRRRIGTGCPGISIIWQVAEWRQCVLGSYYSEASDPTDTSRHWKISDIKPSLFIKFGSRRLKSRSRGPCIMEIYKGSI